MINDLVKESTQILEENGSSLDKRNAENIDALAHNVSSILKDTALIASQYSLLSQENTALHTKLDNANEMLVLSR